MHLIKIIALSVLLVGLVQAAPTNTAQDDPTEAPTTAKPTDAPTTVKPTEPPTTAKPTEGPTPDPTTAKPTEGPTPDPTTAKPTEGPTTTPGPVAECEQLTLDGCGGKFPKLIFNIF